MYLQFIFSSFLDTTQKLKNIILQHDHIYKTVNFALYARALTSLLQNITIFMKSYDMASSSLNTTHKTIAGIPATMITFSGL